MPDSPLRLAMLLIALALLAVDTPLPAAPISTAVAQEATPLPDAVVGLELVFEARPAPGETLRTPDLLGIRATLLRRMAMLGVTGGVTRQRDGQILVRVDATSDPERLTRILSSAAQLEIIDPMGRFLAPGTMVATTLGSPLVAPFSTPSVRDETVYETIVSGEDFRDVFVSANPSGDPAIGFILDDAAAQRLHAYTSSHRGQTLSVLLDKRVISSPRITGAIAARGIIEGVPPDDLDDLVIALRAGAFPVPLALVEQRVVPATRVPGTPAAPRVTSAEE
ncbi:MAG: hypothetical protein IT537_19520 [Hyphomicrobiales bacterium]|nr:hypothetical protein [Hyphomicrobiales bacterium]